MRVQHERELTGRTRRGESLTDKGSLVRAGRDRTRSEAAASGRSERRRVGSRGGATCGETQIIMEAIRGGISEPVRYRHAVALLTSGTPSHKGTSPGGAQSACRASGRAVQALRGGQGSEPLRCARQKRSRVLGRICCSKAPRVLRKMGSSR